MIAASFAPAYGNRLEPRRRQDLCHRPILAVVIAVEIDGANPICREPEEKYGRRGIIDDQKHGAGTAQQERRRVDPEPANATADE